MIRPVVRAIALLVGWAFVLLLAFGLNDDLDCTGVAEGNECPWRATGDFWALVISGMIAVAIAVLPRRRLSLRLPVAALTFLAGATIFFM